MGMYDGDLAAIIVKNGQWIPYMANNLANTQDASAASAEKDQKKVNQHQKDADKMIYTLTQNESEIILQKEKKEDIHKASENKEDFQNENQEEDDPVQKGIETMLATLFPQWVRTVVSESADEFAARLGPILAERVKSSLGGGS